MELITTYPAAVNSKATVTMGVLDQATTIVEVLDATVLPEAPNLLVLGTDQTAETVLMTARENNTLTIQRAVQGIAKSWPAGTQIARNFTGKDWDDMRSNVEAIVAKILGLTASDVGARPDTWTPTASDVGALPVRVVTSGSFNDIKETGAYYISNNVTDKPANTGGLFIVYFYNSEIAHGYYSPNNRNGECPYMCLYNGSWVFRGLLPLDGSVPMSGSLVCNSYYAYFGGKLGRLLCEENRFQLDTCNVAGNYGNRRMLVLYNSIGKANIGEALAISNSVNGVGKGYRIFGEHNKPTGEYTGNGSATTRTITISTDAVIRNMILAIKGGGHLTLVSNAGVLCVSSTGTSMSVDVDKATFNNGILTLKTNYDCLNKSGETYYYQVL